MQESAIILKRDVRGRVRVPAERREAVVAEFKRSGLSGARFAKLAGIKYPTLMAWVARRGREGSRKAKGRKPLFVAAVVARGSAPAATLIVELAGGSRMSLTDECQVPLAVQLLKALQQSC